VEQDIIGPGGAFFDVNSEEGWLLRLRRPGRRGRSGLFERGQVMRKAPSMRAAILASTVLVVAACGSSSKSGSATKVSNSVGASRSPITLGYVGDFTGVSSSTFADGYGGALARIDAQNAAGGVNGHLLKLVKADTASSPTGTATAVQLLASDHVFGILEDSAFYFTGAKYAEQAGIPVTGYGIDGPEWFRQPYTNMFDVVDTPIGKVQGQTYEYTYLANFLRKLGVTKMGVLAYGISPSAVNSAKAEAYTYKQAGMSICYENLSVPFGGVDFTADVLQIKAAGCNGVSTLFEDASDIAFAQAIKNAGLQSTMKAVLLSEGYDNNVLNQPAARTAIDGDYFGTLINFSSPNAATKQMLDNLQKYDPQFAHGGVPDLGLYSGYLSADLMIYGLEHAGSTPTQTSFISYLRQVNNYNAGGILPNHTIFQHFGTAQMLPPSVCEYMVQLEGSRFVAINGGRVICGNVEAVPGV
jgi:branched-chain amino acid transport system substrate-binding protein